MITKQLVARARAQASELAVRYANSKAHPDLSQAARTVVVALCQDDPRSAAAIAEMRAALQELVRLLRAAGLIETLRQDRFGRAC